jgi:hypothetical protein
LLALLIESEKLLNQQKLTSDLGGRVGLEDAQGTLVVELDYDLVVEGVYLPAVDTTLDCTD